MSLAQVEYPPPTSRGFDEWTWAHYQHHVAIIGAIKRIKGVSLPLYQIWPVTQGAMTNFLEEHQQQHNDYEGILGIPGNDLSSVDFTDSKQKGAWFWLNFASHRAAGFYLGPPV